MINHILNLTFKYTHIHLSVGPFSSFEPQMILICGVMSFSSLSTIMFGLL